MKTNVIDFLLAWSDKVRYGQLVIPEPSSNDMHYAWVCNCGCDKFIVYEDGYTCTNCDFFHSFENVHGSID